MREILFRGKAITSKKWIYGDLLKYADVAQIWEDTEQGKFNVLVIAETVGQYTGLTDKNGKKIFEGDIIAAKHPEQKNAVPCLVGYGVYKDEDSSDDCRYLGFYLKAFGKCCSILTPLSDRIKYEVIGNIFDNPELMEG